MKRNILLLIILFSFLVSIAGCGRKGMPVPPGTLRPERIKDLSYRIVKDGAIITWSVPFRNHDGSPIDNIHEFRIFKAEVSVNSFCRECPPNYGPPIRVKYGRKPEPGKKMIYEDTTVREGFFYTYQVQTIKNLLNHSDLSNKIVYAWHMPPRAPMGLCAKVEEEGIRLSWVAPDSFEDGRPLDGPLSFRVFRRFDDDQTWDMLVDSIDETSFFDRIRRVFKRAEYKVSAIYRYHGTEIESEFSRSLVVEARGKQEIPAPKLMSARHSGKGILLEWVQSNMSGIVGYFVYRRGPDGIIIQLNSRPIPGIRFVDKTKLIPGRYVYWVTAVDDSIPPNESRPSNIKTVIVK